VAIVVVIQPHHALCWRCGHLAAHHFGPSKQNIVITNQFFDKKYSVNSRSHELSEVQVDLFKECEKVQFVVYSKLKSCTELT
jgi:hypothetical protein